METIQQSLESAFKNAIRAAFGVEADPLVTISQNEQFGDYQSNAAMGLSKTLSAQTGQRTNPRQIAEQIIARLDLGTMAAEKPGIAGPGFINVRLAPAWLNDRLQSITNDARLGVPVAATPRKTVVDYSGPNVAKQMHVGHLRSTIIGDAISRVIEFQGNEVIRQNHIGDWGTQFGMLIAHLRHGANTTAASAHISDLEAFYRQAKQRFDDEPTFQDEARKTVVRLQSGEKTEREAWQQIVAETRREYQPVYERLSVMLRQADERGESFYNPFLPQVVKELKDKGLAVQSEGATVVFVDGPDKPPMIIEKTGGGYLYATTDLAGVRYRIQELKARHLIYTHDSRQANHFRQVFDTARKVGWARPDVRLDYAPFGTMLGADGKPFKTRSGDTVKLKDLLDEAEGRGYQVAKQKDEERVAKARERGDTQAAPLADDVLKDIGRAIGIGAIKYADLSKDRTSDYVFSWEKMLSMDGNTGPYLQYAYARICSIQRKAQVGTGAPAAELQLKEPAELALAKHILRFGDAIETVTRELKPHLLCLYLYDLATRFSGFYENCPVIQSQEPVRSSRLALCDLAARTLSQGLNLLGIEHPEQM